MKKHLSITGLTALVLTAALTFTGCGSQQAAAPEPSAAPESKIEQIKKAGKLSMYTNAEFPPYEFVDGNEIVGVDIEIGKKIAEKLDVELEIVNAEFGGIVASIASGKGDVAISGITITEERKEQVDFSVPYVDSVQYIIVPEDSDIEFMENLEGKKAGAQLGTTGAMFVEAEIEEGVLMGKNTEVMTYNSAPTAMQDLIAGRIDAVVIDELVALAIAAENTGYKAVPFKYLSGDAVTEQFGVCVQKGNDELLALISETVEELLESGAIDEFFTQFEGAQ